MLIPRGNGTQLRKSAAAAEAGGLCPLEKGNRECSVPSPAASVGEGSGPTQSSGQPIYAACPTEQERTPGRNELGRMRVSVVMVGARGQPFFPNLEISLRGSPLPLSGL